jgi:hypothetical protein
MIDISGTIAPKSDQLNADDLIAGSKTITVSDVKLVAEDQPVSISFQGDGGKAYKPCKSMRRILVRAWGSDCAKYVGRSMTLYLDEAVRFGGAAVGGIRISHLSHIDKPLTMALTVTRATKKAFTVVPMDASFSIIKSIAIDAPTDLIAAGDAASSDGVAMYSAWLANLDAAQKESIRPHHSRWSKAAKEADQHAKSQDQK